MVYNDYVRPVCMQYPDDDSVSYDELFIKYGNCWIAGWGNQQSTGKFQSVQKISRLALKTDFHEIIDPEDLQGI